MSYDLYSACQPDSKDSSAFKSSLMRLRDQHHHMADNCGSQTHKEGDFNSWCPIGVYTCVYMYVR